MNMTVASMKSLIASILLLHKEIYKLSDSIKQASFPHLDMVIEWKLMGHPFTVFHAENSETLKAGKGRGYMQGYH